MGRYDDLLADIPQPKQSGSYDDLLAEIDKPQPSLTDRIYKAANDFFRPSSVMEGMDGAAATGQPSEYAREAFDNIISEQRAKRTLQPGAKIVDGVTGIAEVGARKGYAGIGRVEAGVIQALADVLGSETLGDIARDQQDYANKIERGAVLRGTPIEGFSKESIVQELPDAATNAIGSVIQTAPSLAAGAVAPEIVLPAIFATTTAQEYGQGREAGLTAAGSAVRAPIMGAFEMAGEKLGGMDKLAEGLSAATRGNGMADLAAAMLASSLREVPSEEFTTTGQFLTDKLPGVGLNQEAGIAEYGQAVKDTALATLLQSGAMGAGGSVIQQIAGRAERNSMPALEPQDNAPQAPQEPQQVDVGAVLDALEKAKLFAEQQRQQDVAPVQAQVVEQPNVSNALEAVTAAMDQGSLAAQPDYTQGGAGNDVSLPASVPDIPSAPASSGADNTPAPLAGQQDVALNPLADRVNEKRDVLQAWMPDLAWQETGGRIIRDEEGQVSGRTGWVPKDWDFDNIRKSVGQSYPAMQKAVQKALRGDKMNAKEQATVTALMDFHDEMSANGSPVDPADTWTQASQEEQDALNHALQDEAWLEFLGNNATTDELSAEIARFYAQEQNDSLKAERAYDDTHGQAEGVIGENPATAPPAVRAEIGIAPAENRAGQDQAGASSQAAPVVSQTGASTPVVSQNPQSVNANEREGVRQHVEALIKRRSAANQMGKGRVFDNALAAAKSLLSGEEVKPAKFKNAAATLKDDKAMSDALMALHDIAKTTKQQQSSTVAPPVSQQETDVLTQPTPQDIKNQENVKAAEEKRKADDTKKAEADSRRGDFKLTGSNRETDVAAANGAQDLFAQPKTRIEDYGEKIGGARKDAWALYNDKLTASKDVDIHEAPLSKSWPEPDYQKMLDGKVDPEIVSILRALRDDVPDKPRKSYKLKQWVTLVESLRGHSYGILDGTFSKDFLWKAIPPSIRNRAELYAAVGHDKSLRGISLTSASYSIYGGVKYDPPRIIWTVEGKVQQSAMSRWPKTYAKGDTKEEAIADFKEKWKEAAEKPAEKKAIQFSIYSDRHTKQIFIGKKVGKEVARLKTFDSVADARKFKTENYDELVELLNKYVYVPNERRSANDVRVGKDWRGNMDVSPQEFAEAFGFRGIEFGNWVENDRRQQDLNNAYDALMDLSAILDVPPKAISLDGQLGLAFGARGAGGVHPASAHYEADKVVINLTKKSGAGSLAHEWFHAVDNYFSRMGGTPDKFVTDTGSAGESVRPEMVQAFNELMSAIRKSGLRDRSNNVDKRRNKPYWGTSLEMAARSFEAYIIHKMQDQNASNDYLANIVSEDTWEGLDALFGHEGKSYPYPTNDEMPGIRAAFDNFFNTVEVKETENGVALLSRSPMKSVEANTLRGARAMNKALLDRADVSRAMYHNELGWIDFVWGDDAKGIQHIIKQRMMNDGLTPDRIYQMLTTDLVEAVANGETIRRRELDGAQRVVLSHNGHEAVLVKYKGNNGWLLTGWEVKSPGAIKEANDSRKATHSPADSSDGKVVAGVLDQLSALARVGVNDAALSRGSGFGIGTAETKSIVDSIKQGWNNAPDIVVVSDMNDPAIPQPVRDENDRQLSQGATGQPEGFFYKGKVYIVADEMNDRSDVVRVLLHETLGHYGLRGAFGDALNPILKDIISLRRADVMAKAESYGLNQNSIKDLAIAAEEVLAEMAQKNPQLSIVKRAIAAISAWLRKHVPGFGSMKLTDAEIIRDYLMPARAFVKNGGEGSGSESITFSRAELETDVPNNEWLQDQIDYAKEKGVNRFGVPYMGKLTGRFTENVMVPVDLLASLKGQRDEQNNVRQADLEWLKARMQETGKLPLTERGTEYPPYIEVAYDGSAWVSEGNHRIMAAKSLGWKSLPVEIRYFDGGERVDGPLSPSVVLEENPGAVFSRKAHEQDKHKGGIIKRDELGRLQLNNRAYDVAAEVVKKGAEAINFGYAPPELRKMIRKMKADVQNAIELAGDVAQSMKDMSANERALISDVVEKMLKTGVTPPEHVLKVAASMGDIMDKQTDDLVALGMLSKDAAERWRGQYLPRFYKREQDPALAELNPFLKAFRTAKPIRGLGGGSLKGRGLYEPVNVGDVPQWESLGWEVRDPLWKKNQTGKLELVDENQKLPDAEKVVMWRDFTPEERERMGENRDALFRFVMGYTAMQKDIALGRLFDSIAKNPEYVRARASEGYTKVPDSVIPDTSGVNRYGNLAGLYVRDDIMAHISQYEESSDILLAYRKALSFWKAGKTMLNPVSHMNNVVSNLTMAHFAGVSYWDAHKYVGAIRELHRNTDMVKEAKEAGLFSGDISREEFLSEMPDDIKAMMDMQDSKLKKGSRIAYNIATLWLSKPMGKAYRFEDDFFKYLIYRDARAGGMSPEDAVDYATQFIFNYDDLPKTARVVRDAAIPFFAYTYKAVPALANTAMKYPWRFIAPAALISGVNAMAYALLAGDDDDDLLEKFSMGKALEEEERSSLPPWMQGRSAIGTQKAVRLGTDERTGLPLYWDIARFIPGGDLFDVTNQAEGLPLPAPIMPSNPVLTATAALVWNKDTFTGKDIVDKNDTPEEAAGKRMDWTYKTIMPAIAPFNRHYDNLMNAAAGAMETTIESAHPFKDYTGINKDGLPAQPGYTALNTIGIKVRPVDLELSKEIEQGKDASEARSIKAEIRQAARLLDKGAISQREYDDIERKAMEKLDKIASGA